jgi:hypothetical protein
MAFTPTPAPTPNLPKNTSYVGSYGQGYVAPKVLGTSDYSSNSSQPMYSSINWNNYQQKPYTPPPTTKLNYTASGSAGTGTQQQSNPFDLSGSMVDPNTDMGGAGSFMDQINNEYNSFNSILNDQEGLANKNFSEYSNLLNTQKTNAETEFNQQKTSQTEEAKKTESMNLAKVRQLLGELSQRNASYTAISGGGSKSEALSESFGREAQQRMGNVMDQTQQSIKRVNDFYNNAITKMNESYQTNLLGAKQTLDENLMNIRAQRAQSATAKQAATVDAWRGYYDNVNNAKIQAAQFKQQYDMWKQQQDLANSAQSGFLQSNANQANEGMANSFSSIAQIQPMQTQSNATNPYYYVKPKKGKEDEVFQQAGLNYSPMLDEQGGFTYSGK